MEDMVGNPRMIKLLNKDVIEGVIKANGPITKPEIARITNLSLVTVNKTVESLLEEKKVKTSGINESTGGRRAQFYEINEELNYMIGLYYNKDVYIGAISNSIGKIVETRRFPVRVDEYDNVMEDTYAAINDLLADCREHNVAAIGIGVPGVVKEGVVSSIPTIPSWEEIDIAKILEEKYDIPILLENDINLAAMGVFSHNYKESIQNLVLVYLEQGIGAGMILNKELFKGSSNFAGEISYIPVQSQEIVMPEKGRYRGNFEKQISTLHEEIAGSKGKKRQELKSILTETIIQGLISIICVVNPEVIVIQDSQIAEKDLKEMEAFMRAYLGSENIPKLVKLKEIQTCSINGVINMCIRETMPVYSLSSRKRG